MNELPQELPIFDADAGPFADWMRRFDPESPEYQGHPGRTMKLASTTDPIESYLAQHTGTRPLDDPEGVAWIAPSGALLGDRADHQMSAVEVCSALGLCPAFTSEYDDGSLYPDTAYDPESEEAQHQIEYQLQMESECVRELQARGFIRAHFSRGFEFNLDIGAHPTPAQWKTIRALEAQAQKGGLLQWHEVSVGGTHAAVQSVPALEEALAAEKGTSTPRPQGMRLHQHLDSLGADYPNDLGPHYWGKTASDSTGITFEPYEDLGKLERLGLRVDGGDYAMGYQGGEVIRWNGKPVGFLCVDDHGNLTDIWIDERYQRRGLATAALDAYFKGQPFYAINVLEDGDALFRAYGAIDDEEGDEAYGISYRVTPFQKKTASDSRPVAYRTWYHTVRLSIEYPKGSYKPYKGGAVKMRCAYGRIPWSRAGDGTGDMADFYLGDDRDSTTVYIVNQNKKGTKVFDEQKCMLGFKSEADAVQMYKAHYDQPELFFGSVFALPWHEFVRQLRNTLRRPRRFTPLVGFKTAGAMKLAQSFNDDKSDTDTVPLFSEPEMRRVERSTWSRAFKPYRLDIPEHLRQPLRDGEKATLLPEDEFRRRYPNSPVVKNQEEREQNGLPPHPFFEFLRKTKPGETVTLLDQPSYGESEDAMGGLWHVASDEQNLGCATVPAQALRVVNWQHALFDPGTLVKDENDEYWRVVRSDPGGTALLVSSDGVYWHHPTSLLEEVDEDDADERPYAQWVMEEMDGSLARFNDPEHLDERRRNVFGPVLIEGDPEAAEESAASYDNVLDNSEARGYDGKVKARLVRRIAAHLQGDEDFRRLDARAKGWREHPNSVVNPGEDYDRESPEHYLGQVPWTVESGVNRAIKSWAQTASNSPLSCLMQYCAREELDLPVNDTPTRQLDYTEEQCHEAYDERDWAAMRRFVRAVYEETQALLRGQGIEHIYLYRGMGFSDERAPQGENYSWDLHVRKALVCLQPLSSFSARPGTATGFGGQSYQTVLAGRVPSSRVFSLALTGPGCRNEEEMLVIGGPTTWRWVGNAGDMPHYSPERYWGTGFDQPIDPNNAPPPRTHGNSAADDPDKMDDLSLLEYIAENNLHGQSLGNLVYRPFEKGKMLDAYEKDEYDDARWLYQSKDGLDNWYALDAGMSEGQRVDATPCIPDDTVSDEDYLRWMGQHRSTIPIGSFGRMEYIRRQSAIPTRYLYRSRLTGNYYLSSNGNPPKVEAIPPPKDLRLLGNRETLHDRRVVFPPGEEDTTRPDLPPHGNLFPDLYSDLGYVEHKGLTYDPATGQWEPPQEEEGEGLRLADGSAFYLRPEEGGFPPEVDTDAYYFEERKPSGDFEEARAYYLSPDSTRAFRKGDVYRAADGTWQAWGEPQEEMGHPAPPPDELKPALIEVPNPFTEESGQEQLPWVKDLSDAPGDEVAQYMAEHPEEWTPGHTFWNLSYAFTLGLYYNDHDHATRDRTYWRIDRENGKAYRVEGTLDEVFPWIEEHADLFAPDELLTILILNQNQSRLKGRDFGPWQYLPHTGCYRHRENGDLYSLSASGSSPVRVNKGLDNVLDTLNAKTAAEVFDSLQGSTTLQQWFMDLCYGKDYGPLRWDEALRLYHAAPPPDDPEGQEQWYDLEMGSLRPVPDPYAYAEVKAKENLTDEEAMDYLAASDIWASQDFAHLQPLVGDIYYSKTTHRYYHLDRANHTWAEAMSPVGLNAAYTGKNNTERRLYNPMSGNMETVLWDDEHSRWQHLPNAADLTDASKDWDAASDAEALDYMLRKELRGKDFHTMEWNPRFRLYRSHATGKWYRMGTTSWAEVPTPNALDREDRSLTYPESGADIEGSMDALEGWLLERGRISDVETPTYLQTQDSDDPNIYRTEYKTPNYDPATGLWYNPEVEGPDGQPLPDDGGFFEHDPRAEGLTRTLLDGEAYWHDAATDRWYKAVVREGYKPIPVGDGSDESSVELVKRPNLLRFVPVPDPTAQGDLFAPADLGPILHLKHIEGFIYYPPRSDMKDPDDTAHNPNPEARAYLVDGDRWYAVAAQGDTKGGWLVRSAPVPDWYTDFYGDGGLSPSQGVLEDGDPALSGYTRHDLPSGLGDYLVDPTGADWYQQRTVNVIRDSEAGAYAPRTLWVPAVDPYRSLGERPLPYTPWKGQFEEVPRDEREVLGDASPDPLFALKHDQRLYRLTTQNRVRVFVPAEGLPEGFRTGWAKAHERTELDTDAYEHVPTPSLVTPGAGLFRHKATGAYYRLDVNDGPGASLRPAILTAGLLYFLGHPDHYKSVESLRYDASATLHYGPNGEEVFETDDGNWYRTDTLTAPDGGADIAGGAGRAYGCPQPAWAVSKFAPGTIPFDAGSATLRDTGLSLREAGIPGSPTNLYIDPAHSTYYARMTHGLGSQFTKEGWTFAPMRPEWYPKNVQALLDSFEAETGSQVPGLQTLNGGDPASWNLKAVNVPNNERMHYAYGLAQDPESGQLYRRVALGQHHVFAPIPTPAWFKEENPDAFWPEKPRDYTERNPFGLYPLDPDAKEGGAYAATNVMGWLYIEPRTWGNDTSSIILVEPLSISLKGQKDRFYQWMNEATADEDGALHLYPIARPDWYAAIAGDTPIADWGIHTAAEANMLPYSPYLDAEGQPQKTEAGLTLWQRTERDPDAGVDEVRVYGKKSVFRVTEPGVALQVAPLMAFIPYPRMATYTDPKHPGEQVHVDPQGDLYSTQYEPFALVPVPKTEGFYTPAPDYEKALNAGGVQIYKRDLGFVGDERGLHRFQRLTVDPSLVEAPPKVQRPSGPALPRPVFASGSGSAGLGQALYGDADHDFELLPNPQRGVSNRKNESPHLYRDRETGITYRSVWNATEATWRNQIFEFRPVDPLTGEELRERYGLPENTEERLYVTDLSPFSFVVYDGNEAEGCYALPKEPEGFRWYRKDTEHAPLRGETALVASDPPPFAAEWEDEEHGIDYSTQTPFFAFYEMGPAEGRWYQTVSGEWYALHERASTPQQSGRRTRREYRLFPADAPKGYRGEGDPFAWDAAVESNPSGGTKVTAQHSLRVDCPFTAGFLKVGEMSGTNWPIYVNPATEQFYRMVQVRHAVPFGQEWSEGRYVPHYADATWTELEKKLKPGTASGYLPGTKPLTEEALQALAPEYAPEEGTLLFHDKKSGRYYRATQFPNGLKGEMVTALVPARAPRSEATGQMPLRWDEDEDEEAVALEVIPLDTWSHLGYQNMQPGRGYQHGDLGVWRDHEGEEYHAFLISVAPDDQRVYLCPKGEEGPKGESRTEEPSFAPPTQAGRFHDGYTFSAAESVNKGLGVYMTHRNGQTYLTDPETGAIYEVRRTGENDEDFILRASHLPTRTEHGADYYMTEAEARRQYQIIERDGQTYAVDRSYPRTTFLYWVEDAQPLKDGTGVATHEKEWHLVEVEPPGWFHPRETLPHREVGTRPEGDALNMRSEFLTNLGKYVYTSAGDAHWVKVNIDGSVRLVPATGDGGIRGDTNYAQTLREVYDEETTETRVAPDPDEPSIPRPLYEDSNGTVYYRRVGFAGDEAVNAYYPLERPTLPEHTTTPPAEDEETLALFADPDEAAMPLSAPAPPQRVLPYDRNRFYATGWSTKEGGFDVYVKSDDGTYWVQNTLDDKMYFWSDNQIDHDNEPPLPFEMPPAIDLDALEEDEAPEIPETPIALSTPPAPKSDPLLAGLGLSVPQGVTPKGKKAPPSWLPISEMGNMVPTPEMVGDKTLLKHLPSGGLYFLDNHPDGKTQYHLYKAPKV